MKISTQLIIIVAIFILALIVIVASVILTDQQIDQLNRQQALVDGIEKDASELGYLSNDYLLYRESHKLDLWNSKYASLSAGLASLDVDTPEQQVLVRNIQANRVRLKEVFEDVVLTINRSSSEPDGDIDSGYTRVSWGRLTVQTRGIIFDASRLSQMLQDEENQVRQSNTILISSVMGAFIVFVIVNYFLVYRHTIKSIESLQAGTKIIGSGNLDHEIPVQGKDEICELAAAFNQMTAHLKTVTTSKAELEKEIVERRHAEEALKEAKLQSELYVDLMSHDINNLNQQTIGYLELALDTLETNGKLGPDDRDLLSKPLKSLNSSSTLIDNVRKLQMLVNEGVKARPIDLCQVLKSIDLDSLRKTGRDITINMPELSSCTVQANELLKDVLYNLISNAIKHSDETRPLTVNVRVEPLSEAGKAYYQCSVEDNGPGVPDELKGKLFHRFQRGATKAHGKGLGLYLVRMLVESYQGKVWVEDRVPGDHTKGARFVITLPAA